MESVTQKIQSRYMKPSVVALRSGDTVKVHQKIVEGGKERIQIFEGLVIRTSRTGSLTQSFTVRRIASGVGVEKTYLIHSPNILKIEVAKRSKVRRNYLSYMRSRTGKSARLMGRDFDRQAVNAANDALTEEAEAAVTGQLEEAPRAAAAKAEPPAAADLDEELEHLKSEADKIEEQPKERAGAKGPAAPQNKA